CSAVSRRLKPPNSSSSLTTSPTTSRSRNLSTKHLRRLFVRALRCSRELFQPRIRANRGELAAAPQVLRTPRRIFSTSSALSGHRTFVPELRPYFSSLYLEPAENFLVGP